MHLFLVCARSTRVGAQTNLMTAWRNAAAVFRRPGKRATEPCICSCLLGIVLMYVCCLSIPGEAVAPALAARQAWPGRRVQLES